jgi:hypothetical protein
MSVNAIGARQRVSYDAGLVPNAKQFELPDDARSRESIVRADGISAPSTESYLPAFNEEYFEWIDILESVKNYASHHAGRRPYFFAELGAGFGRWTVNAVRALQQACPGQCEYFLCAVEADKQHFEWLKQNLWDNGIDPDKHLLLNAPLTGDGRRVSFMTGAYGRWYGQAIVDEGFARELRATGRVPGIGRMLLQKWIGPWRRQSKPLENEVVLKLKSTTLDEVLRKTSHIVDIADLDLQEMEAEVIEAALPAINERVMRFHIGTHSLAVEERLRKCLKGAGWILLRDYPCLGSRETPYGQIAFGDGVQSWINPRFEG